MGLATALLLPGSAALCKPFVYAPADSCPVFALTLVSCLACLQAQKVYVQQRLAESADLVWQLLEAGAHFYVCGDAGSMAGQVEEALLAIIEQRQGQGREGAQAYLDGLAAQHRYERDVWF